MTDNNNDNEPKICCFCLGTETDIPPFGELKDGKDFLHPCSTCSLIAHRKCLLDWFNSIPVDKLHIVHTRHGEIRLRPRSLGDAHMDDIGVGAPAPQENLNHININISSRAISNWLRSMSSNGNNNDTHGEENTDNESDHDFSNEIDRLIPIPGSYPESEDHMSPPPGPNYELRKYLHLRPKSKKDDYLAYIVAPCPQCKQDIIFTMYKSKLLAFHTRIKSMITTTIESTGIFVVITSAITGILSMGYIGLTSCGMKMMDCIVPGPLLVQTLRVNDQNSYGPLSRLLFGNPSSYSIDNLEQALAKGLIDPIKFSRMPLLPLVLYRARCSSILDCFFGKNRANSWYTELMIAGYFSSWGNHELLKGIFRNLKNQSIDIFKKPSLALNGINLLKGINLWKTNNIISMLVPLRWVYDIIYRLTINRAYFQMTLSTRPRDIANRSTAEQFEKLEKLRSDTIELSVRLSEASSLCSEHVKMQTKDFFINKIPIISSVYKYIKSKIMFFRHFGSYSFYYTRMRMFLGFHYTLASFRNDYSTSWTVQSRTMFALTTILWPYISSKVGSILAPLVSKYLVNQKLIPEKHILLSNIAGLVTVAIISELIKYYLSRIKAKQMTQINALSFDNVEDIREITQRIYGGLQDETDHYESEEEDDDEHYRHYDYDNDDYDDDDYPHDGHRLSFILEDDDGSDEEADIELAGFRAAFATAF